MKQTLRNHIFSAPPLTMVAFVALILFGFSALGQTTTVSGEVRAADAPLPGVSIFEKGTTNGTATDSQGKYTLNVSSPASVLVFSFIGYKTVERPVDNQSTLNIIMEDDVTALNEVVVTALGMQKDVKSLGYSVQKVEGKDMVKAREPNIINSLTGKVAGLEIRNQTDLFADPGIRLRGAKPLIVIDGVPSVDNDLWKVNADDIENFSVLKGATASALYGSIGRNGAIMITTKRGAQNKVVVDVNSSTMFQTGFIRIPRVQTTYGNGNNGQYAYVDGSGSGTEGGGWIWGPKLDQPDPTTPSGMWETTQFNSPIDPDTGLPIPTPFLSRGKDNVRNFFRTGLISTNNISVSGGGEDGNFRVSVSNAYQRGIVPNSQLNNTSFGVAGGYKLSKQLKADASLTYNRQYTDNFPETGYGPNNYLYNLILWTGPDIDVRDLKNYWKKGQEGVQQRHYNTSWYNNPYFQATEYQRGYYKDNVFGQLKLDYNVLPGLDLTARTGINQYSLNRTWKEPKSYVAYDYVSNGNFYLSTANELNINTDFIAQYNKEFSENVTLRVSAGGASRWRTTREQNQNTDGLVIPEFYNLANSRNPLKGNNRLMESKVNSLYGTLDLELFNGIFLGATGRNDWVSTLSPKNNSFFYPSVSLAGVVTDFTDLSNFHISFLKIRSSWSRVGDGKITELAYLFGNNADYPYQHLQGYSPGVNWNGNPSLTFPNVLIDSEKLTPQTSDTFEAGLDIRLLDGRFGLDIAAYSVHDFNTITPVQMSPSSGYEYRLENLGGSMRKGLEITATASVLRAGDLTWDITANWSKYHRYLRSKEYTPDLNIKDGTRLDQIYNWEYLRTPGGHLVLDNGYPVYDPFQRKIGYSDPDFIFGLQNSFTFKNFGLNVSLDGRIGGLMYSTTNQKMWWGGTHPGTVNQYRDDANNGLATYIAPGVIIVEGDVEYDENGKIVSDDRIYAPNAVPVNYISWNVSTSNALLNHYYDQSFVKLREVTLTYNLPNSFLSKTFINKASISFVGRNLALWTKMPEVDPDPGSDNLQTPSTRNIGFNVNFSF
jgi:TonB-linked SusC/RagA family outer membrane protein